MCVQYLVVWYFISTPFKCLPSDEITESLDNKSYHGNDDHTMEFVNQYYNDFSSPPNNLITASRLSTEPHKRVKRVHVFRPLFVYRQEQIKRKRIIEKRREHSRKTKANPNAPTERPAPNQKCTCCDKCRRY